jgi:hypothetical protein
VRDRLYESSKAATPVSIFFALVAVALVLATRTASRARGVLIVARCVGVLSLVAAVYQAWYALTTHTDLPTANANESFFAIVGLNWWYRAAGLISAAVIGVMAILVLCAARRASARPSERVDEPRGPLIDFTASQGADRSQ